MLKEHFMNMRSYLIQNTNVIIGLEQHYMQLLVNSIAPVGIHIESDFNTAHDFIPFWVNYPPLQRGRAPSGLSVPWQEVGETVIGAHVLQAIQQKISDLHYPGLPSGADIRLMTHDAIIHLDIKITGPNDRADEVVASPNQISGDGKLWENSGVKNMPVLITGQRADMTFQPELPPFYIRGDAVLVCLTYFLKGVYSVESFGKQPLDYLELICVPNGLMAFDSPNYNQVIKGLFIPGKDEQSHPKKRVRVRMNPLYELASWRRAILWKKVN